MVTYLGKYLNRRSLVFFHLPKNTRLGTTSFLQMFDIGQIIGTFQSEFSPQPLKMGRQGDQLPDSEFHAEQSCIPPCRPILSLL